jgi:hypothetical protein
LIAKLDRLVDRPLTVNLTEQERTELRDKLQGIEETKDGDLDKKLGEIKEALKEHKNTLADAGFNWEGGRAGFGGGGGPGGPRGPAGPPSSARPSPFVEGETANHLKALRDRLARSEVGEISGKITFAGMKDELCTAAVVMELHPVKPGGKPHVVALTCDGTFQDAAAPLGEMKVTFRYSFVKEGPAPSGEATTAMKKKFEEERAAKRGNNTFDPSVVPQIPVKYWSAATTPLTQTVSSGKNNLWVIKVVD